MTVLEKFNGGNMNNISLIGRITKNLELRTTSSDKSVCEFTLAVNRMMNDTADFITVQIWGKQAENLVKYQTKGSQIAVVGSYRVDSYKDKDNNTKYKHYVLANQIEYLSKSNTEQTSSEDTTTITADDFNNVNFDDDSDSLPF